MPPNIQTHFITNYESKYCCQIINIICYYSNGTNRNNRIMSCPYLNLALFVIPPYSTENILKQNRHKEKSYSIKNHFHHSDTSLYIPSILNIPLSNTHPVYRWESVASECVLLLAQLICLTLCSPHHLQSLIV